MSISNNLFDENGWQIATLTYNINGKRPSLDVISKWMSNEQGFLQSKIVCIALQEISHAEIFSALSRTESWTHCLNEWFCARNFVLVGREQLASNLLLVYSVPELLSVIARVDSRWSRTSFAGHKGTISCRLLFKDGLSLVFLTSHFIHGEENLQLRINQYRNSIHCTFDDENTAQKFITELAGNDCIRQAVFWLGDFNFRIEGYRDSSETLISKLTKHWQSPKRRASTANGFLANLIEHHDQLTKLRCSGKVFGDFKESIITFLPTYRILVRSGHYDSLRVPSWCDRILYKTSSTLANHLEVLRYSSCREITVSDHFPVSALFRLSTRKNGENTQQKTLHSLNTKPTIQTRNYSPLSAAPKDESPRSNLARSYAQTTLRWTCTFATIPTWDTSIPLVCRFRVDSRFWHASGAYRDWLGIYLADRIGAVTKPLYWVYLLTCYNDDELTTSSSNSSSLLDTTQSSTSASRSTVNSSAHESTSTLSSFVSSSPHKLRMVAEFPALTAGRYRIGYFSIQRNCLQGLSDIFSVISNQ